VWGREWEAVDLQQVCCVLSKWPPEKKRIPTQAVKITPHINYGKGATLVPGTVNLLHQRKNKISMRIRRIAGLT